MILLTIALAALVWLLQPRPMAWPTPVLLGKAEAFPDSIRRVGDTWYWIERPDKRPASLVRATPGSRTPIATGPEIAGYTTTDDTLTWTRRDGAVWSIVQAGLDGKNPRTLWRGTEPPLGACAVEKTLYWLRRTASRVPGSPFPPLGGSLEVVALEGGADAPKTIARLPEIDDGAVLGAQGDSLVVVVHRRDHPGSTSLYRVPRDGGSAVRFHSAARRTGPLLTRSGALYGLVPSEEAAPPLDLMTVVRLGADGRAETLSDWLPADGSVYETARGVVYGDRASPPTVWTLHGSDALPEALTPPDEFVALAAGERALLLATGPYRKTPTLYEVPLP